MAQIGYAEISRVARPGSSPLALSQSWVSGSSVLGSSAVGPQSEILKNGLPLSAVENHIVPIGILKAPSIVRPEWVARFHDFKTCNDHLITRVDPFLRRDIEHENVFGGWGWSDWVLSTDSEFQVEIAIREAQNDSIKAGVVLEFGQNLKPQTCAVHLAGDV